MTTFSNKIVFVTGASSGIGEATALAFAEAGARVYGTARTDAAAREAHARHPQIHWLKLDVRDAGAVHTAVDAVLEQVQRIDVLVNNAGVARLLPLQATSAEDIALQFETNVYGLTYVTQAALPALQGARGTIVNVASTSGHKAQQFGSLYGASKAAVEALTRSWALELAPTGVRVNAVSPGPVRTPIIGKLGLPSEMIATLAESLPQSLPLQRIAEPSEIAHWVLALADSRAGWVTGQVVSIDGGQSIA